MTRSIFYQYTATLTPFVFVASAMALAKLRSCRRYAAYLLLLVAVLTAAGSETYYIRRHTLQLTPHAQKVKTILAGIPSAASLRTHEFFAAHAADRKELHIYENNHPKEGGSWKARHTDFVAIDRQVLKDGFDAAVNDLRREGFQPVLEEDGFVLFKNANPTPEDENPTSGVF